MRKRLSSPTGNTNTHGKFPPDVRTFLRNWTLEGPTYHFALGVGHHAAELKKLGRAKVVGTETAGDVIGTFDLCLLDYGVIRRPRIGFFLPDGTDMECHGAKPDIEVETTPADIAAGRDPQLDAAVDALAKEAAARKATPPPPLKYAR